MSRPVELTTPMTPDSLRQTEQLLKHLYGQHTSKNMNASEVDGTEFVGTVENFGSEILSETTQLRQINPNTSSLHMSDAMNFYFDLKPSGLVNTLGQQNILCAMLKKIDFLYTHVGSADNPTSIRFDIVFSNVVEEYAIRPKSKSKYDMKPGDVETLKSRFYSTTNVPILRLTYGDSNDPTIEEYPLSVTDDSGVATRYMFMVSKATEDLIPDGFDTTTLIINIQSGDANDTGPDADRTYVMYHDNRIIGTPFIWIQLESFKTLPDVGWFGNVDNEGRPILLDGIDLGNQRLLYPRCQPGMNVPQGVIDAYNTFPGRYIAYRAFGKFSSENDFDPYNYEAEITGIEVSVIDLWIVGDTHGASIVYRHTISFDNEFAHIRLNDVQIDDSSIPRKHVWSFGKPGSMLIHPTGAVSEYELMDAEHPEIFAYTYHALYSVNDLSTHSATHRGPFRLILDEQHHIHQMEQKMNHATVGVHIDSGTDYSDNAVPKKRGLIHDFSRFDGLPGYMSEWNPKDIKRGHVEMYSVRDNVVKNDPLKRQTAGIILDSAVPQNDVSDIIDGLSVVITYSGNGEFDQEIQSISTTNALSDIGYAGNGIMGYSEGPHPAFPSQQEYEDAPKLIYHGNGDFSLNMVGFDPELESGRVFILSNDPTVYSNASVDGRPGRTFARICDLPTSYLQLTHITGKSPTFVLNQEYVRQGASFSLDDQQNVWNDYHSPIVHYGQQYILTDAQPFYSSEFMTEHFSSTVQSVNGMVDLTDPANQNYYSFTVVDSGDCVDGDTFMIVIGGVTFTGTFHDDGVNQTVTIDSNPEHIIPIANIPMRESVWSTTCTSNNSHNPEDLVNDVIERTSLHVKLTISQEVWDNLNPHAGPVYDDLYVLKFDRYGNIFAYHYTDNTWDVENKIQVYGDKFYDNIYDKQIDWFDRKFDDVIVRNWNGCNHSSNYSSFKYLEEVVYTDTSLIYDYDDQSEDIQETLLDYSQSYYVLDTNNNLHVVTTVKPNRYLEIPRNNGFNSRVADQNLSTLLFGSNSVEFFDPLIVANKNYTAFSSGIVTYSGHETYITRERYFGNLSNLNMYDYSVTNDIEEANDKRETYMTMTFEELSAEIYSRFGEVDLTDYTHDMLVDYLMERSTNDPIYRHSNLKLMRPNENPTGGYVNLYDDIFDTRVRVNGSSVQVSPEFVFRFSETINEINTAVGGNWKEKVRMYDEDGNDISEYSLIIIENKLFTYSEGLWNEIQRSNS